MFLDDAVATPATLVLSLSSIGNEDHHGAFGLCSTVTTLCTCTATSLISLPLILLF
jgi:hypothetical protein